MRHLTFGDKAVFVSDAVAEAVIRLALALSDEGRSDTVTVPAVTELGNRIQVTFLLTPHTTLAAETTDSRLELPDEDDADVVAAIARRAEQVRGAPARPLLDPPPALPDELG
ncbi:hypothetical protein ACIQLJ_16020 [Microbacterium sp. NPDC091313]